MEPAPAPCGELAPPPIPAAVGNWLFLPVSAPAPPRRNLISAPPSPPHPRGCSGSAFVSLARAPPVPDGGSLFLQERPC